MTAALILNPHARQGRVMRLLPQMQAWLGDAGLDARIHVCGTPEALDAVFAQLPPGSRVVGVGGDGTNHRLLPHVLAGAHEYGVLPYGSGDDVARAVGLFGLPWQEGLRHALTAPTQAVDVALALDQEQGRERHFFGCFLLGMDGHINNQTSQWKFNGPLPYFLTLLKELPRLRGWKLALQWQASDGSQGQAQDWMLLCSLLNTPTYGSGYPIAPMAHPADGRLQLLYAPMVGRWRFLDLFFKMLAGKHVHSPHAHFRAITRLTVRSEQALCLSADGEVIDWQTRHLQLRVLPQALRMVVGPGFVPASLAGPDASTRSDSP